MPGITPDVLMESGVASRRRVNRRPMTFQPMNPVFRAQPIAAPA